jgi:predicted amidohydrolase
VNRTGSDPFGNNYDYSSQIIDPWGSELQPQVRGPQTAIFDVNFDSLRENRIQFRTSIDRNVQLYKEIL